MNPDLPFWGRLIVLLAAQIIGVVLLMATIETRLTSGRGRKWMWRAAFVMSGCWLLTAVTGLDRSWQVALHSPEESERRLVIRNHLPAPVPKAELLPSIPATQGSVGLEARETARPIWWPGYLWLGVTVILWARVAMGQAFIVLHVRRRGRRIERPVAERMQQVAERLGVIRRVVGCELPEIISPVTHGWWNVRVALPAGFEAQYSKEQQEAILSHELAHAASRDPLWLGAAELITATLWWHPLIWWARARLRHSTELAADEASVVVDGGPAALAECLVELAGQLRRRLTAGWLGVRGHGFQSGLGRRVRHLLERQGMDWRPHLGRGQMSAMILASVAVLAVGVLVPGWVAPRLQAEGPSLFEHVTALVGAGAGLTVDGRLTGEPEPSMNNATEFTNASAVSPESASPEAGAGNATDGDGQPFGDLQSRTYHVDVHRLRAAFGDDSNDQKEPTPLAVALREYLNAAGVPFGTTNTLAGINNSGRAWQSPAGRSLLFNELNGRLLLRATPEEHRLVTQALDLLLPVERQILIEAKFIEITEPFDLGMEGPQVSPLGTRGANGQGSVATVTGIMSDPMFNGLPARSYATELRGDELDWVGRSDPDAHRMRVISSMEPPWVEVLDEAKLRALVDRLQHQNGADVMAAPRVTTLSGRPTEMSVVELRSIVAGIEPDARVSAGPAPVNATNAGPFRTRAIPCGPVLNVIAKVSEDGPTIELEVGFNLTESLGYAEAPGNEQVAVWDHGSKTKVTAPIPRFGVRKMKANARLSDGETLFMAGGAAVETVMFKDSIPVLGDIPVLGRLFRSERESQLHKRLIVLITAFEIDPAGNRLHPTVSAGRDQTAPVR